MGVTGLVMWNGNRPHGEHRKSVKGYAMADDSEKVYRTGLTAREAEEIQGGLMWGSRIFFGIAVFAHILAYMFSPWMH